jgi:alpha-N-arabinofuranosidase
MSTPPNDESPDSQAESTLDGVATVSLDGNAVSEWTVDENVFGKFTEMNAREGYPGIYSEYLANGSFEDWYTWPKRTPEEAPTWWRRSEVIFRDVEEALGVAFPWEGFREDGARVSFEHAVGGVHGRGESGRERTDVHGRVHREPERRYQRITVWEGRGGVEQRIALPDRRTLEYVLSISVRGAGLHGDCRAELVDPDGTVLAAATLPVAEEWERHDVTLELDAESSERYRDSAFGTISLLLTAEGQGHVDLDWAQLRAGDAVEGKYNPTTIENIREYGIPSLRWPGGNFTSQYHWADGVGPVIDRPVRTELHWGGLEPNYLGTNEFLEFCEVAGVDPYLNVGFSEEISPEEAAEWVEYVNGDPDETEMGALRAEHGYEEPWGVTVFQVGNEVWGTFQIGHIDPQTYGERYLEYYEAIKAVDPDITVFAVGCDPGMGTWEGRTWNETLFEIAGDAVEGLDLHRYVHGEGGDREWDEYEFNQQLVLFPTQFEDNVEELRELAAEHGVDDLEIDVGEWNMGAGGLPEGRRARYGTTAHASFCAGMYNAFIRQGEAVKYGYQRDNAYKFRPYPADLRPVWTANNAALALYTELFHEDENWHHVPTDVESPGGDVDRHGADIEAMSDVPFVDSAALRDADGESTVLYLTNRNLRETISVTADLGTAAVEATVTTVVADDPLDDRTGWDGETSYRREERSLAVEDDTVTIDLPPAAVTRIAVEE